MKNLFVPISADLPQTGQDMLPILIFLALAIIGILVYFIYKKRKKDD